MEKGEVVHTHRRVAVFAIGSMGTVNGNCWNYGGCGSRRSQGMGEQLLIFVERDWMDGAVVEVDYSAVDRRSLWTRRTGDVKGIYNE